MPQAEILKLELMEGEFLSRMRVRLKNKTGGEVNEAVMVSNQDRSIVFEMAVTDFLRAFISENSPETKKLYVKGIPFKDKHMVRLISGFNSTNGILPDQGW